MGLDLNSTKVIGEHLYQKSSSSSIHAMREEIENKKKS